VAAISTRTTTGDLIHYKPTGIYPDYAEVRELFRNIGRASNGFAIPEQADRSYPVVVFNL
jgi:hypothetical protein